MGMKFFTSPLYIAILGVGVVVVILLIRAIMKLNKRPNKKAKDKATKGNFIDVTINPNAVLTPLKIQIEETVKPPEPTEVISKTGTMNARIYDIKHLKRCFRHVELLPDKDYGRYWDDGQKKFFKLVITPTGLQPLQEYFDYSMKHSHPELIMAISTYEYMKGGFGKHDESGDKIKLGLLVFAACVALFIMFMAIYKKGGG